MLRLDIETTDRSSWIDWTSLSKDEGLTREPDVLSFSVLGTADKTPFSLGDTVELYEDSTLIFAGVLVERREAIEGGLLVGWDYSAKDYTHTLDKLLVAKTYENMTASAIVEDIITNYTDGTFTTTNVQGSSPTIKTVRFNYEPVSRCLAILADQIGWDFFIGYDKDVHFFYPDIAPPVLSLTDTSGGFEWASLVVDRNIYELTNSVIVRGGEYKSDISESDARDVFQGDGTQTMFPIGYKYADIVVKVNGVSQTIGADYLTDPTTVDVLYNFMEKFIRFNTAPTSGHTVKVYGKAYIPVIARVRDGVSIATYGEYQNIVVDRQITSVEEAQRVGRAKLLEWSDGKYEGSFRTRTTGLRTGDMVSIDSTIRGISGTYKINHIAGKAISSETLEYTIQFLASGSITFADMIVGLLGEKKKNIVISDEEVVQRLETLEDNVGISDSIATPVKTSPPYYIGTTAVMGFFTMG
jgi:hypothetical protein